MKLKLKYFGHWMQRTDSFEKTLMLGKVEGERRRGQQRMRWLDGITSSMDMSLGKLWDGQASLVGCSPLGCKESNTTQQLNGTELTVLVLSAQLCLTPCDPTDCSLPGSSVHGIPQARILEWVFSSSSREYKDPN